MLFWALKILGLILLVPNLLIHTLFYVRDMLNLRDMSCTNTHEPLWRVSRPPATFTEILDKCCEATTILVVPVPFYPQFLHKKNPKQNPKQKKKNSFPLPSPSISKYMEGIHREGIFLFLGFPFQVLLLQLFLLVQSS